MCKKRQLRWSLLGAQLMLNVRAADRADGGYNHERVTAATNILVEIVRKQPDQAGFVVLPRRWAVERFFAWISRNRRLAKDFEATINSAAAFLYAASAMILLRRLARTS
jgi:transposase